MKPWSTAETQTLASVKGICLDIDETLSTHGKLTAEAYAALSNLKKVGFFVVPLTGRPAGWCDHIARFWPVDAVVGENGAFTFFMNGGVRCRMDTPSSVLPTDAKAKLHLLSEKILKRFPHAKWASDQAYREFDLAIDICEDVPHWPEKDVKELLDLCHAEGAHAKLSSIHVNTWFGDYDKLSGIRHWLSQSNAPALENWLFIGDSPNDEPAFKAFSYSVGVANLKKYLPLLKYPPRWITENESGSGFVEMADRMIQLRT